MIVFISFWLLTALTFSLSGERASALRRNAADWTLDISGLLVQGLAIPALEVSLIYGLLNIITPQAKGVLDMTWALAFLLNFVIVDYLYYWNHRLLHSKTFWKIHAVHHTADRVDLFITSRNTLWAPLLIVYVWVNGIFLFLLKDPVPFLLSASITASLDLWRHTSFFTAPGSLLHRAVSLVIITPNEHVWHHSSDRADSNFGANLSIWDRIHGTYVRAAHRPESLGIPLRLGLNRKLLFPFRNRRPELPR
jgi:sterol desaturase/sphingolipid hydroxylase (fatty acid hydroxylase superfamily)